MLRVAGVNGARGLMVCAGTFRIATEQWLASVGEAAVPVTARPCEKAGRLDCDTGGGRPSGSGQVMLQPPAQAAAHLRPTRAAVPSQCGTRRRRAINHHWRTTFPSVITGVALVVMATLLIAGYGVPVGIGFSTGLILGALASFATWFWLRAGADRSVSFANSWHISSSEPQPMYAELEEQGRLAGRLVGIEESRLIRVQPIVQTAEKDGVRVELVSMEVREQGCLLAISVSSQPPAAPAGSMAQVAVSDDIGTAYFATGGGGQSTPSVSRLELRFAPSPPDAARELTIRIDEFLEPFYMPGSKPARLVGPWEFRLPIE